MAVELLPFLVYKKVYMTKLIIQSKFGVIPNELLNNPNITFKAKGLFGYLQSKTENWDFSADRMQNDTKESRDAILSGLKELEDYGYLKRIQNKNNKGQREHYYILSENPKLDNPLSDNAILEKSTCNKKRNSKKEIVKKKYIYTDFEKFFFEKFNKNENLIIAWQSFKNMRAKIKKPATDESIKLLINKLLKYGYDVDTTIKVIEQSIENGRQGLFPLRIENQNPKNKNGHYGKSETSEDDFKSFIQN